MVNKISKKLKKKPNQTLFHLCHPSLSPARGISGVGLLKEEW